MKKIIHLSDLHFGKVDKRRIDPLLTIVNGMNPDLVVISGDLTQRATEKEYKEVQDFLKQIKPNTFIIPGNHDIPLYNVFERWMRPFKKYSKFISPELAPVYMDNEIAVVGINSVRSSTISSGRINKKQIEAAENIFSKLSSEVTKIVVCHHPFDLPHSKKTHHKHTHKVIGRSKLAMDRLAKQKVDLFLSGHLHVTHIGDTT
ncbi:MAG: metallophosphoesterase, partial [Candidatus Paceibacterota bacterium]